MTSFYYEQVSEPLLSVLTLVEQFAKLLVCIQVQEGKTAVLVLVMLLQELVKVVEVQGILAMWSATCASGVEGYCGAARSATHFGG